MSASVFAAPTRVARVRLPRASGWQWVRRAALVTGRPNPSIQRLGLANSVNKDGPPIGPSPAPGLSTIHHSARSHLRMHRWSRRRRASWRRGIPARQERRSSRVVKAALAPAGLSRSVTTPSTFALQPAPLVWPRRDLLSSSAPRRSCWAVLAGPPGVGKTRLRPLLERAASRGSPRPGWHERSVGTCVGAFATLPGSRTSGRISPRRAALCRRGRRAGPGWRLVLGIDDAPLLTWFAAPEPSSHDLAASSWRHS